MEMQIMPRMTEVAIDGEKFFINGDPTYIGRRWNGHRVEGLLFNSRMVQGVFDDLNPATRGLWTYPDTGQWDAQRNTREFIEAMPLWHKHGLLAFTINLQGGSPQGYSNQQPWHNSAIDETGDLRPDFMRRLEAILDRADELGMVVILGLFYFGQDERLCDEKAIVRAVDNAMEWLFARDYGNVIIEITTSATFVTSTRLCNQRVCMSSSNACSSTPTRAAVFSSAQVWRRHRAGRKRGAQRRLSVAARQRRGKPAADCAVGAPNARRSQLSSDADPLNEDDHFDFDKPHNNMLAALREYSSWGYFDFRMQGEDFDDGYQSVPVNWSISSARKRGFFSKLAEITGANP
jgi:hypothetical protein